jgi:hypothetical protein
VYRRAFHSLALAVLQTNFGGRFASLFDSRMQSGGYSPEDSQIMGFEDLLEDSDVPPPSMPPTLEVTVAEIETAEAAADTKELAAKTDDKLKQPPPKNEAEELAPKNEKMKRDAEELAPENDTEEPASKKNPRLLLDQSLGDDTMRLDVAVVT